VLSGTSSKVYPEDLGGVPMSMTLNRLFTVSCTETESPAA
jgi:hypothetical protein